MKIRFAALVVALMTLLAAAACAGNDINPKTQDIVSNVPWTAPESYRYLLKEDGKDRGQAILSITKDGDRLVMKQAFKDDEGNTDGSTVTVDAATLKPLNGRREVTDAKLRSLVESTYEPDKHCSSGTVVRIKLSSFKPPSEQTPSSTRRNPDCVRVHAYDNDTSLWIWRTIRFEKGYSASYNTVITKNRAQQGVTVTVRDRETVDIPAGKFEAWRVDIRADRNTQRAWFATTPDRRLLQYRNGTLLFVYEGTAGE